MSGPLVHGAAPGRTGVFVIWEGIDAKRWEVARVELAPNGIRADGTQVRIDPVAYRLDYRLAAPSAFGPGCSMCGPPAMDGAGGFVSSTTGGGSGARVEDTGTSPLGPPGANTAGLTDALDCDLGLSPLTNLLPLRRADSASSRVPGTRRS
jgi:hypothetical protein